MQPLFKTLSVTSGYTKLSDTPMLFSGYIQSNADSVCSFGVGTTDGFNDNNLTVAVNDTVPRNLSHLVDLSTIVVNGSVGTTLSLFGVAQPVGSPLDNSV